MVRRGSLITVVVLVACYPPKVPGVVEEPDACHFGTAPQVPRMAWTDFVDDPFAYYGRRVRFVGRLSLGWEYASDLYPPSADTRSRTPSLRISLDDALDERSVERRCSGSIVSVEGILTEGAEWGGVGTIAVTRIDAVDPLDVAEEVDARRPATIIDANVVTVGEYDACARAKGCEEAHPDQRDHLRDGVMVSMACNSAEADRRSAPMNCVGWRDAAAYCSWAGKRLPTEHEWYVARHITQPRDAAVNVPSADTLLEFEAKPDVVWEWTRSCAETKCARFDRILVRQGPPGLPYRLSGTIGFWGTMSAELGFRCAR